MAADELRAGKAVTQFLDQRMLIDVGRVLADEPIALRLLDQVWDAQHENLPAVEGPDEHGCWRIIPKR